MCSFKGLASSWNNNQQKQKELLQIEDHKDLYTHLAIGFIVY